MGTRVLGKYHLVAELGHGGMADVFLAVATGPSGLGFSKLCVVKQLREHLAEDPEFVTMLVDEARVAARLGHPNAIQTHEIGEHQGSYFIAMEYLDGQPLSRILASTDHGKRIPLEHSLAYVADVLAGLHHAHELKDFDGQPLGVVHRDVTPHNVFVTYDGHVKIVDFGIAKARGRALETKQGVVKGKLAYMAPEQALAEKLDRRADVYAVGVILWELVAGTRMWGNEQEQTVVYRLITGDLPKLLDHKAGVDPRLVAIVERALARQPHNRYASADEMAADVIAFLATLKRPSARDLGGFVAELFPERRKKTQAIIERQLAKLGIGAPSSASSLPAVPHKERVGSEPEAVLSGSATGPIDESALRAGASDTSSGKTGKTGTEPMAGAPARPPSKTAPMPAASEPHVARMAEARETLPAPPPPMNGTLRSRLVAIGVGVMAIAAALSVAPLVREHPRVSALAESAPAPSTIVTPPSPEPGIETRSADALPAAKIDTTPCEMGALQSNPTPPPPAPRPAAKKPVVAEVPSTSTEPLVTQAPKARGRAPRSIDFTNPYDP